MSNNETQKQPLPPAQYRAIAALLTTGDVASAAVEADVGRSTIYRWMKDAAFLAALREAESQALEGLARALAGLGDAAAGALRAALADGQPMPTRLRAAQVVIDNVLKLRQLVELEHRLAALEMSNHAKS